MLLPPASNTVPPPSIAVLSSVHFLPFTFGVFAPQASLKALPKFVGSLFRCLGSGSLPLLLLHPNRTAVFSLSIAANCGCPDQLVRCMLPSIETLTLHSLPPTATSTTSCTLPKRSTSWLNTAMLKRRGPGAGQGALEGCITTENGERGGTQGGRLERSGRRAASGCRAGCRGGGCG